MREEYHSTRPKATAKAPIRRFTPSSPCPVCGGWDRMPRGKGTRCFGFLSADGDWAHCSREDHAGQAKHHPSSNTFAHKASGECPCGVEHAPVLPGANGNGKGHVASEIDRTYDYHDASGKFAFQVVRYRNPKTFKQRRPNGANGWFWNLKGVERVLYRLPELRAADPAEVVIIAEGEKDADRLRKEGFVATTNPMGAGKWRDEYSEELRGRRVVIIPDNDQAGKEHAERVARSVHHLAASVQVVELPGLPDKGDVCDFLDAGGTAEQLGQMIYRAPHWMPTPKLPANGKGRHVGQTPDGSMGEPINRTDLGNARRLVKRFGDVIRYCPQGKTWLIWDGKRWREDQTGEIYRLAKKTVRSIGHEAAEATDDEEAKALLRWALESESKKRLDAMIALAWSEPGIPIEHGQLNQDPMLLNVENGTIDLRTGRLRPHRPEDLITKLAPVRFDPSAPRERWLKFLGRIMEQNKELIDFLSRAAGYGITGSVVEHALFFLYGTGRNGKSTFLEVILKILGDYATTIDANLLISKRNEDHPTGLTDLDGRRFVPTAETEDGKRLAEALVKKLTDGGRIKARRMRENNYEFEPTHKIFLAANHKPEIRGTDEGIWSRIKLIPFNVFIPPPERVKDLVQILIAEEGPGILAWLVAGCLEWQRQGLAEPKAVVSATAGYRTEMDALGDFLDECCDIPESQDVKKHVKVLASALYQRYADWARANGLESLPSRKFGSEMEQRGFRFDKSNGKCWRHGLTIKPSEDPSIFD